MRISISPGLHGIDHKKLASYEKSIEADKLLVAGRIDEARLKMTEAASLNGTYIVRAELIGHEDTRKIVSVLRCAGRSSPFFWKQILKFQKVVTGRKGNT